MGCRSSTKKPVYLQAMKKIFLSAEKELGKPSKDYADEEVAHHEQEVRVSAKSLLDYLATNYSYMERAGYDLNRRITTQKRSLESLYALFIYHAIADNLQKYNKEGKSLKLMLKNKKIKFSKQKYTSTFTDSYQEDITAYLLKFEDYFFDAVLCVLKSNEFSFSHKKVAGITLSVYLKKCERQIIENEKLIELFEIISGNKELESKNETLLLQIVYEVIMKFAKAKIFQKKDKILHYCMNIHFESNEERLKIIKEIIVYVAMKYFENNEFGFMFTSLIKIFDEHEWKHAQRYNSILLHLVESCSKSLNYHQIYLSLLDKILIYLSGLSLSYGEEKILENDVKGQLLKIETDTKMRLNVFSFLVTLFKNSPVEALSVIYIENLSQAMLYSVFKTSEKEEIQLLCRNLMKKALKKMKKNGKNIISLFDTFINQIILIVKDEWNSESNEKSLACVKEILNEALIFVPELQSREILNEDLVNNLIKIISSVENRKVSNDYLHLLSQFLHLTYDLTLMNSPKNRSNQYEAASQAGSLLKISRHLTKSILAAIFSINQQLVEYIIESSQNDLLDQYESLKLTFQIYKALILRSDLNTLLDLISYSLTFIIWIQEDRRIFDKRYLFLFSSFSAFCLFLICKQWSVSDVQDYLEKIETAVAKSTQKELYILISDIKSEQNLTKFIDSMPNLNAESKIMKFDVNFMKESFGRTISQGKLKSSASFYDFRDVVKKGNDSRIITIDNEEVVKSPGIKSERSRNGSLVFSENMFKDHSISKLEDPDYEGFFHATVSKYSKKKMVYQAMNNEPQYFFFVFLIILILPIKYFCFQYFKRLHSKKKIYLFAMPKFFFLLNYIHKIRRAVFGPISNTCVYVFDSGGIMIWILEYNQHT